jgi:hypothetical protein
MCEGATMKMSAKKVGARSKAAKWTNVIGGIGLGTILVGITPFLQNSPLKTMCIIFGVFGIAVGLWELAAE